MLSITKINNSTSTISYKYLESEHVWGISVTSTYSFSILDASFAYDDTLLEGIEALKEVYSKKNIAAKIGLDEFKNGLVTNISFPSSDRVRLTNASISIEENIRVENDGVLSDLLDNVPSQQDVESFSETIEFTRGENSYSYQRSVSLRYKQDPGSNFIAKAHLFLKNIYLGSRPPFGFQIDGISENARLNSGLKPMISEFYDEINKEFRFSENFESNQVEVINDLPFSKTQTYEISVKENGYTDKSYSNELAALSEPLELNIQSGVQFVLNQIIADNTGFGYPVSIEKSVRSDGGKANLSISFTNDPRRNSITTVDYSAKKRRDEPYDGYDFEANIESRGPNHIVAFNNSLSFFQSNRNIAYEKIPALFPEINSGDLNEITRNVSFKPFERGISESVSFSTNPSYGDFESGVLKREISISDTLQVDRNSVVPIYGYKEIIIKNDDGKTLGSRGVSVNMISQNDTIEFDTLIKASGETPPYNYSYITNMRTSYSPLENSCSASVGFNFFD